MNFFKRRIASLRRRRRIKAARSLTTPLREFVYLDEVSVYSLLASRQGALASEYTDTSTSAARAELSGKIGLGAGATKGELSSKREQTYTQSSQVLRKSTVQAAFKELYEGEEGRLGVTPLTMNESPPRVRSWQDLATNFTDPIYDGWVIRPSNLERGLLVELEIELSTHSIFKMTSIMSALSALIVENPELFPQSEFPQLQEVAAVNRVLDKLLVGLIPLRCRALDYCVVDFDGERVAVHTRLMEHIAPDLQYAPKPLHVVGVTEELLYWKDVRRVLFTGQRFRILSRLNASGVRSSWVPVKLVDVLRDVVPDLAAQVEQAGRAFGQNSTSQGPNDDRSATIALALIAHSRLLAEHYDVVIDADQESAFKALAAHHCGEFHGYDARRRAFEAIANHFATTYSVKVDSVVAAQFRSAALADTLLLPDGQPAAPSTSTSPTQPEPTDEALLDAEVVAIYW
ncbi:hypothetical protein AB0C06_12110 [Micromonospora inaquosa]|uniref:DUF6414 family protein n=1 Tax=Micromonospora inaquosa TaxID=2203716 RepID=UPI00341041CD